jgi:hypothetical protein
MFWRFEESTMQTQEILKDIIAKISMSETVVSWSTFCASNYLQIPGTFLQNFETPCTVLTKKYYIVILFISTNWVIKISYIIVYSLYQNIIVVENVSDILTVCQYH